MKSLATTTIATWIINHPTRIITVDAKATLAQCAQRLFNEPGRRDLYVVGNGRHLIGHISHDKLAKLLLARHRPNLTRSEIFEYLVDGAAADVMDSDFETADTDDSLDDVLIRMLDNGVEDLPIVDADGCAIGSVNMTEVLRQYADVLSLSPGHPR